MMGLFRPKLRILPPAQRALWPELRKVSPHFVLYGGTALALRLGHRDSEDFDFFSSLPISLESVLEEMPWLAGATPLQVSRNTAVLLYRGVKLSFFSVSFGRVDEPQRTSARGLFVASLLDLAATKLKVIAQRAHAKDYLDVAAILDAGIPLATGLGAASAAYGPAFDPHPTIKALGYFEDGNLPTLPERVKEQLSTTAQDIGPIPRMRRVSRQLHVRD